MDLPGNPIPRVIRRLLFVLAPRHTAPACRSIERFKREQPELMTFFSRNTRSWRTRLTPVLNARWNDLRKRVPASVSFNWRISWPVRRTRHAGFLPAGAFPPHGCCLPRSRAEQTPSGCFPARERLFSTGTIARRRGALDALEERPLLTRMLKRTAQWRPADAMLRDVAGISPPTSDSPADCIRRVRQKRNSHSRNMAAPTPSYRR